MEDIRARLFVLQDMKYRDFHAALMPTVDKNAVIGVRMPALRALAKELQGSETMLSFMAELPHIYYEENNLHGLFIMNIKDYDVLIEELEHFLPYIDNWATCDLLVPKLFKKHTQELLHLIKRWIASDHTYTRRFAMGMLMSFYLEENFEPEYAETVAAYNNDEYYIKMMVAWYFATALAKQWDAVIPFIEQRRLEPWTHRKTIQKAIESFRITDTQKIYLRTLK